MTETSALAAVAATKSNIVDAEAEVKRINDSKAKNTQAVAAANAAITAAKQSQDKATAALAAAKATLTKPSTKPVAVALSADGQRAAAVFDDGRLTVWAIATGTAVEDQAGPAAPNAALAARQDGAFTAPAPDGKARVAGAPSAGSSSAPSAARERAAAFRRPRQCREVQSRRQTPRHRRG